MNSIRHPRSRSRADSFSFATLFWVLRREAVLRVVYPASMGGRQESVCRFYTQEGRTDRVVEAALLIMRSVPSRRWWSPRGSQPTLAHVPQLDDERHDSGPIVTAREFSAFVVDADQYERELPDPTANGSLYPETPTLCIHRKVYTLKTGVRICAGCRKPVR